MVQDFATVTEVGVQGGPVFGAEFMVVGRCRLDA